MKCPDDGACHHDCGNTGCFRVLCCEPLSIAGYKNDRWPWRVRLAHRLRFFAAEARR